jgi:hypothetical protein
VVGASVTAPLVFVPAAVLVVAGIGKLRAPTAASDALRAGGLPSGRRAARLVGVAEAGVGVWAIATPAHASLAAAAALYAILAWFAVRLLRAPVAVASCGCFGADAPPSALHAGFDVAAALALALAAVRPPPGIAGLATAAPVAGVGLVAGCCAAAYAVTLVLAHLPAAVAAYRPQRGAA